MEDRLGIEPRPYGLKARYSTSELPVHFIGGFGGTRTLNPNRATDFKSVVYANSTTKPNLYSAPNNTSLINDAALWSLTLVKRATANARA